MDSLRLVGDGYDEPILRVFNPLPAGILVSSKGDGKEETHRVETLPETGTYRRFRGQIDRGLATGW